VLDLLFVCDAGDDCGFGHASRCAAIARLVQQRRSEVSLAFQGRFTEGALRVLSLPDTREPTSQIAARVAVVDRMADPQDMNACSPELLRELSERTHQLIYIASGVHAPALPAGAICVGYQPGGPAARPPGLRWGLQYAPVGSGLTAGDTVRDPGSALIALGGAPDLRATELVLNALAQLDSVQRIDLLASPVSGAVDELRAGRADQRLQLHVGVENVAPLLAGAGLVVASYGNLAFEALALGAPLCLVGQKLFQVELAAVFEQRDLAISAGLADDLSLESLVASLRRTVSRSAALAAKGPKVIDGRGLDRLADMVVEALDAGAD